MRGYAAIAILSLVLALAAPSYGEDLDAGGLQLAGSSTILPLAETIGILYQEKYHQPVRVRGGGSTAGIENVLSGEADIGLVSRALRDSEKSALDCVTIGHDAVMIVVNRDNPLAAIRKDALVAIYSGELRNWRELGGKDESVLFISKLPGRSTLEIFEEYTGLSHRSRTEKPGAGFISDRAHEIGSNLESATLVGGLPGAIGYISMGTALSLIDKGMPLKILGLDGIKGTKENVINGRYPVRRELTLVFTRDNQKVERLIELFLSPAGQNTLREHGFIPAGWRQSS